MITSVGECSTIMNTINFTVYFILCNILKHYPLQEVCMKYKLQTVFDRYLMAITLFFYEQKSHLCLFYTSCFVCVLFYEN